MGEMGLSLLNSLAQASGSKSPKVSIERWRSVAVSVAVLCSALQGVIFTQFAWRRLVGASPPRVA